MVLGHLVVQSQHLETVQGELDKVQEAALQAKAKIVDLEQSLDHAAFKRNELQDQLNRANSKLERQSQIVDAAGLAEEKRTAHLETMQSELAETRQALGQAEAKVARLDEQVSSLNSQLRDTVAERHALGTKLQSAQTQIDQLRSELNVTKSELVRLRPTPNEQLDDARGKSAQLATPMPAKRADGGGKERDYLIRTLVFEASGETEIGKAAVAHVVLNRKRIGRWGDRIQDVVTHPWQFEPWMTRKSEIKKLSPEDPRYLDAAKIVDAVLGGDIPDPTAGATHFLNPVIVRQRRGGSLPPWADGDGQPIGRHVFYIPERNGAEPQQAEG